MFWKRAPAAPPVALDTPLLDLEGESPFRIDRGGRIHLGDGTEPVGTLARAPARILGVLDRHGVLGMPATVGSEGPATTLIWRGGPRHKVTVHGAHAGFDAALAELRALVAGATGG